MQLNLAVDLAYLVEFLIDDYVLDEWSELTMRAVLNLLQQPQLLGYVQNVELHKQESPQLLDVVGGTLQEAQLLNQFVHLSSVRNVIGSCYEGCN